MRYYSIKITKANGDLFVPASMKKLGLSGASYTSYANGQNLTSALEIIFEFPIGPFHKPAGNCTIQIFGVGLEDIAQINDLVGATAEIRGGMKRGLPLAFPYVPDLLVVGKILKAFGNWQGPTTSLAFVLTAGPDSGDPEKPPNLTMNVPDGKPLADALKTTLEAAYPGYKLDIKISDALKMKGQQAGYWGTLNQMALALFQFTQDKQFRGIKTVTGMPYGGVVISATGNTIHVFDGTQQGDSSVKGATVDGAHEIKFIDLVGQPTWIDPNKISFSTVLRGDIVLGEFCKLPKTLATPYVLTGSAQAAGNLETTMVGQRDNTVFQGNFKVDSVHHHGNFRQPTGEAWVTVFEATPVKYNVPVTTQMGPEGVAQPEAVPPQVPVPANVDNT